MTPKREQYLTMAALLMAMGARREVVIGRWQFQVRHKCRLQRTTARRGA